MKKILCTIVALAMITLAACGAPAAATPSAPAVVAFADPVLEAMVRATMGKPEGDITVAEAEAVTRLNLGIEWQRYVSEETPIQDIGGLESFINLESLDLSYNAITDITPLAGLEKLTLLFLGGNPVADIAPLAGLTNLKVLNLSGCAAQGYSPLAGLVNLEILMLDDSAITDVSPLAALTGLKKLYLADCQVADYSLLADIYPGLEEKDFTMASTLSELGFTRNDNSVLAGYSADGLTVTVNHSEWGIPEMNMEADTIRLYLDMDNGYRLTVGYDPDNQNYVFNISQNGENLTDYVYITLEDSLMFNGDRERVEDAIRTMLGDTGSGDILLAPIPVFNDTIRETFGMTADALYALPFAPPTLLNLGFTAYQENACYLFEQHDPWYYTIEVNNPEWGAWDEGGDVRFFTPLSDEYRIVVTYDIDEKKFLVGADDNDEGSAKYEYFAETNEHIDGWCSNNEIAVEQYFKNAINNPEIQDVYLYAVQLMENYISDMFGMSIDELYALPVGD